MPTPKDSAPKSQDEREINKVLDDVLRQVVCECGNYRHHGVGWMPECSGEGLHEARMILWKWKAARLVAPAKVGEEREPDWDLVHTFLESWEKIWQADRAKFTAEYPKWMIDAATELFAHDMCDAWVWQDYVKAACVILARHAPAREGWIDVKDRLPKDRQTVIVARSNDYPRMCLAKFYGKHEQYDCGFYEDGEQDTNVTHWQPLPEPPARHAVSREKENSK